MDLLANITQKEINSILDNPVDQIGNKIKLRSISHEKLTKHIKNIPYKIVEVPQMESSKTNLSNAMGWNLMPKQYVMHIDGPKKPINIKTFMLNNILKKGNVNNITEIQENHNFEISSNTSSEIVEIKPQVEETVSIKNNSNDKFVEINNARQLLETAKKEADVAEQDAKKSDEELNQLSIEQVEMEKKLEAAKKRKTEILKQLNNAFENQSAILLATRKKYEAIAREAKARKESNENRIIEFRNNIDNTVKLITKEEQEIAQHQELLNALELVDENVQMSSTNDYYQENNEDGVYHKAV